MSLNFPDSPIVGQQVTDGTKTWQWNGTSWKNITTTLDTTKIPLSTVTTAGDLIVATGNAAVNRLGVGTNGQVLTSNGTTALWAAPTGGSGTPGGSNTQLQYNNGGVFAGLPSGNAGETLVSGGAGVLPTWTTSGAASQTQWKSSVRLATTSAITLSGVQTVDGVMTVAGDRILVKNQGGASAHAANGIYEANSAAWIRASDADSGAELLPGSVVYVTEGNTQQTQAFAMDTTGTIVVGTTPLHFTSFNSNQTVSLSGDVGGSGTTSIPVTLTNSGVTAGTYTQLTVDSKGRATVGANPTTLVGYGITDAVNIAGATMAGYLTLNADPITNLQAATKQYVDSVSGGPGITVAGGLSLVGNALSVVTASVSRIVVNANNIDLAASGATAGTYNSVTVDTYGRVTSGSTVGNSTITLTGDITGSGTSGILTALSATGVTAGTYTGITVDASGRITGATPLTTLAGYGITDAVAKSGSTMTGSLTLSGDPTLALHAATKQYVDTVVGGGLVPGNGLALAGNVLNIVPVSGTRLVVAPGTIDLATSGVTAGTYTSLTVDAYGRVTSGSTPAPSNEPITLSGDVTGTGTTSIPVTLANTGVISGTYKSVNVDAKGRVTAGSNPTTFSGFGIIDSINSLSDVALTSPALAEVLSFNGTNWVNTAPTAGVDRYVGITANDTSPGYLSNKLLVSNNFTTSVGTPAGNETLSLELSTTGVSAGTYTSLTVDTYGRVTAGSTTSGTNQPITLSGDATGTGATAITVVLSPSGVTAGTYTQLTVDSKGRATVGANPTTLAAYGITDAQPLNTFLTNLTSSTSGLIVKNSNSSYGVTITGTAGRITVTNGNGVSGAPTIDLVSAVLATPGTYTKVVVDTYGRVTSASSATINDISGAGTIASQNANAVTITGGTISQTAVRPRISNVTYAASLTLDWSTIDVARITLTGNIVITNSGAFPGQRCLLELKQDATGSRTVAFTSETRFCTDITGFTPSTAANKLDRIGFVYDETSTTYDVLAVSRGY